MDVVTAFLNPDIDKDVYMALPKHLPASLRADNQKSITGGTIVKLLKALYGLKQSPRLWFEMINSFLTESLGLTPSPADPNLYVGTDVLLLLYVDDILLVDCSESDSDSASESP